MRGNHALERFLLWAVFAVALVWIAAEVRTCVPGS